MENSENLTPTPQTDSETTQTVAKTVVVEDSVTHQAGEGVTAGMSSSLETPDIFDNSAQPEIKTVVEEVPVVKAEGDEVIPEAEIANPQMSDDDTIEAQPLMVATDAVTRHQLLEGENNLADNLQGLSDGTVDIPRD